MESINTHPTEEEEEEDATAVCPDIDAVAKTAEVDVPSVIAIFVVVAGTDTAPDGDEADSDP